MERMATTLASDEIGMRYGTRIVTAILEQRDTDGHARIAWRCDCGREGEAILRMFRHSRNCKFCKPKPKGSKPRHGYAMGQRRSKLYDAWANMRQRCNPKSSGERNRKWYSGKGIIICEAWQTFEGFCDWALANGWREGLSLDRIDPRKNYQPDNCEWITREENSRRASILLKRLYALRELQSSQ